MAESVHSESDDSVGDLREAEELCGNFSIYDIGTVYVKSFEMVKFRSRSLGLDI